MSAKRVSSLAGALLATLAGCGSDTITRPDTYTCDQSTTLKTCVEHGVVAPADLAYAKGYCEASQGTWLTNQPCPRAGAFGKCDMHARGGGVQYFYSGCTWCTGIDATCTSNGGIWTPLP